VNSRPVLLCLAASLVFAGPAHAVLPAGNVVVNGDAEASPGATNQTDHPVPQGWDVVPSFTSVVYGTAGFPTAAASAEIGGGTSLFAGGPDAGIGDTSYASQTINLAGAAAELDGANVYARLSADLGGSGAQGDSATVGALFTDSTGGNANGFLSVGPVSAQDRGNVARLLERSQCTQLTPGARQATVFMVMQRIDPPYNDAYADNVSVTLSTTPCPPNPDADLPPASPPQQGVTGNATPVRGRVFIRRPGATGFQELRDDSTIPVGSTVDAEKGTVQIETSTGTPGKTQVGKFRDGKFVMTQTRGRLPITDLVMTGGQIDKCPRAGQQATGAARRPARRLWGDARGRFRTRGRYATATVRGTFWMVRDTCTTTEVQVARGSVLVRDLVKRRNIRLKAPRRYVARARGR
jgi:hypothetical protein